MNADPLDADPLAQLAQIAGSQRAVLVGIAVAEGLRAEEALEVVQDALGTWLVRARQRGAGPNPVASLKRMVRNAARNGRRRHFRLRPHTALDDGPALAAALPDPEQLLSAVETTLRLRVCVAELREVERAVVTLRLLEERSGQDVAEQLGLSRAHVDVLVHRAKLTLRACMHAQECSGGDATGPPESADAWPALDDTQ